MNSYVYLISSPALIFKIGLDTVCTIFEAVQKLRYQIVCRIHVNERSRGETVGYVIIWVISPPTLAPSPQTPCPHPPPPCEVPTVSQNSKIIINSMLKFSSILAWTSM
jgi:hypothetical protein